jgi:hypothetical protein
METINSFNEIKKINNNFTELLDTINTQTVSLRYLDLYNLKGSIFNDTANQDYASLPLGGALIWHLETGSTCLFLGETYHNGDYILKLNNDKPLKIEAHQNGMYHPVIDQTANTIKYEYAEGVESIKTDQATLHLYPGNDGSAATWYTTTISASETASTQTLSTEVDWTNNTPLINFYLQSNNSQIYIDYSLKTSGKNITLNFPDGCPSCTVVIR